MLEEIKDFVDQFNDPFNKGGVSEFDGVYPHFTLDDLNKLAFCNATGSGKTLIMHVNIRQILSYARKYKSEDYKNMLLITPNEGLSK